MNFLNNSNEPKAQEHPYGTINEKATIPLHTESGTLVLHKEIPAIFHFEYAWQPNPSVCIHFEIKDSRDTFHQLLSSETIKIRTNSNTEPLTIVLAGGKARNGVISIKAYPQGHAQTPSTNIREIRGYIINAHELIGQSILQGEPPTAIHHQGRTDLSNDDWSITLDQDPHIHCGDNRVRNGENKATHAFSIKHKSNKYFQPEDTFELIDNIQCWITLISGSTCTPILLVGLNDLEEISWKELSTRKTNRYHAANTWMPKNDHNNRTHITNLFHSISDYRKDKQQKYVLDLAIHWYTTANQQASELEGSIALAQNALELLSHWQLTQKRKHISPEGLEKLNASDSIRLLLGLMNLDPSIPTNLESLRQPPPKGSKRKPWVDGPHAITEIRNSIVHPSTKNIARFQELDDNKKIEAFLLMIQYIELSILHMLDYKGRLHLKSNFEPRPQPQTAPWA